MAIQTGIPVVFGVKPQRPIINIPENALKIRVRLRSGRVGQAFVKFPDRIEQWVLGYEGDSMKNGWALRLLEGVNLK